MTTELRLATPVESSIRKHTTTDGLELELAECLVCEGDLWKSKSWDWEHMDTDKVECPPVPE